MAASAPASTASGSSSAIGPTASQANQLALVFGRLKDYAGSVLKLRKPWSEVMDRSAISKPNNVSEAVTRIKKNCSYFRINYLIVMVTTCVITFLMNPSSLFVLGLLLAAWIYVLFGRQAPIVINGRTLSDREKLLSMAAISFITIFFLTSVGTVFFYALSISTAVVVLHGAVREPDNLFLDEAESQQGLLSLFSAAPQLPPTGINVV